LVSVYRERKRVKLEQEKDGRTRREDVLETDETVWGGTKKAPGTLTGCCYVVASQEGLSARG
jgi:hypothetical protein